MIALRWALTVILALLWLLIAAANASYEWRELVRKEKGVPSVFPLVGGLIAWLAAMACPSDSPLVTLAFWLALILDVGSLPYGVLAIVALTLETMIRTKEEEHFWKRSYLGSSWAVKFAMAVLGWLFFLVLVSTLGMSIRQDEASGPLNLLVATVIYWVLYALFHIRLWKYKSPGRGGS